MIKLAFWFTLFALSFALSATEWGRMWAGGQHRYLPLLVLLGLVLIAVQWDFKLRWPSSVFSRALTLAGVVVAMAAFIVFSPWLSSLSSVLMLGGFFSTHRARIENGTVSWKLWSFLLGSGKTDLFSLWPLSWFAMRLPWNWQSYGTEKLERVAINVSSYALDAIGVAHRKAAGGIELQDALVTFKSLQSLQVPAIELILSGTLIAVLLGRSVWLQPVYMSFAAAWSTAVTSAGIVLGVCANDWFNSDLTVGWSSLFIMTASVGVWLSLYLSSDRLTQIVFFPIKSDLLVERRNPIVTLWNKMFYTYGAPSHVA